MIRMFLLMMFILSFFVGCRGTASKRQWPENWKEEIRQMHQWGFGSPPVVPGHLFQELKHWDFRVRSRSAIKLGEIGVRDAIPYLTEALKDENAYVRCCAAGALKKITKQDFGATKDKH